MTRTCADCSNQNIFEFSKVEIAFELYDSTSILNTPCSNCGSQKSKSLSTYGPDLDQELLDLWGNDESLHFMEQDEELMLSDVGHFDLLLKAIDANTYLKSKIGILIEAVCIMIFDYEHREIHAHGGTDSGRDRIVGQAKVALAERKEKVMEYKDSVMPYIREVVFPLIGLKSQ